MPSSLSETPQIPTRPSFTGKEFQALRRPRLLVEAVDRFVRLHFLGFTFLLVLLGGVSVSPSLSVGQLLLLLAVGMCFHNFSYVLNDVIDLPVDRTQPARSRDYLVRGVIKPWQALLFALAQVPPAVALSLWAGAPWSAIRVLLLGFGLMTIYDLWGKKCAVPPLTDLAQGLGWGCLVLYGALALGASPNILTWVAFASGAGFILLINGVHGGLRDLTNDLAQGSLTTAIFFGSRPTPRGATVSSGLKTFAMTVQCFLVLTTAWALVFARDYFSIAEWRGLLLFQGLLQGVNLSYMLRVFRTDSSTWERDFRLHLLLLLMAPAALLWPTMEGLIRWIFPVLFLGPFLLVEVAAEISHLLLLRLRRLSVGAPESALMAETPGSVDRKPAAETLL